MNAVVGRSWSIASSRSDGVELAADHHRAACEQRATAESDGDRMMKRRADEVRVVGVETPLLGLLVVERFRLRLREHTRPHAFRLTAGARRVVHRSGKRVPRELGRWPRDELGEHRVVDDQLRVSIGDQRVAFTVEQPGIEHDRHDSDAQRAQDRRQHVAGGRGEHRDAVCRRETTRQQRTRHAPLRLL